MVSLATEEEEEELLLLLLLQACQWFLQVAYAGVC
jgi:hypothetical protein